MRILLPFVPTKPPRYAKPHSPYARLSQLASAQIRHPLESDSRVLRSSANDQSRFAKGLGWERLMAGFQ